MRSIRFRLALVLLACLLWPVAVEAQAPAGPAEESSERLEPVTVTAPPPLASSSEQIIPGRDFELRPQGRPADVLRLIPGLIINQHQGGGKAEQYIIRGFDADHGTDLALFVDGVPVNLRSHAHGQGYADLHFLIPETVRAVDVLKGPYFAEYGDFATAGTVKFITRDFVEENTLEIGGGSFNTQRYWRCCRRRAISSRRSSPPRAIAVTARSRIPTATSAPQHLRQLLQASEGAALERPRRVLGHRPAHPAGAPLDGARRSHGPAALRPVVQLRDALRRRPHRRRLRAPHRARLHAGQHHHALSLPEPRGLPDR